MNDFYEENKKKIITIGIIVAITIVIAIINMLFNFSNKKLNTDSALKELGKAYYEELYYPYMEKEYADNYKTILGNYSEKGIKVTLRELVRSIENSDANFFYTKGNYCNFLSTYVIIYPESNFKKEDYKLKTNVSCVKKISK